ncbi:hypothetical protein [Lignipirellula cremea]|uniref:SGNH/GDSL hydrolase family protein n=1 Tax=Lignipirellula cremea TaxID=2528010 RepID=A0A518DVW3_9BACT|nr:hypothetical protein [Lignipirellula cremea]QDU95963.1 hypothetical protein Pla8534_37820 [Lignipirellula cremea]
MRIVTKLGWIALLLALGSPAIAAEPVVEPHHVLMVGNSLTYTYNIPAILARFAAETDRELTLKTHFAGGKDLTWHWSNARKTAGLTAAQVIEQGDFDLVILQDSSRRSLSAESREEFVQVTKEYQQLAAKKSTRLLFYMGFLRNEKFPEDQVQTLDAMYTDQADALGISCAPVALAFQRCHQERPDLALLDNRTDGKYALNKTGTHQSPFGSYLAACTIYAALYDRSPVGLEFRAAFDQKKEVTFEKEDTAAAQDIAWRTWQAWKKRQQQGS